MVLHQAILESHVTSSKSYTQEELPSSLTQACHLIGIVIYLGFSVLQTGTLQPRRMTYRKKKTEQRLRERPVHFWAKSPSTDGGIGVNLWTVSLKRSPCICHALPSPGTAPEIMWELSDFYLICSFNHSHSCGSVWTRASERNPNTDAILSVPRLTHKCRAEGTSLRAINLSPCSGNTQLRVNRTMPFLCKYNKDSLQWKDNSSPKGKESYYI